MVGVGVGLDRVRGMIEKNAFTTFHFKVELKAVYNLRETVK